MKNYAAGDPVGNNSQPIRQAPAPFKAVAATMSENATVSALRTLNVNATAIEVATQGTPALIRWIPAGNTDPSVFGNASIMNFDHVIPSNTVRRFVIPVGAEGYSGAASVSSAAIENGLFRQVAYKTNGIASVFLSEYGSSNSY